MRLHKLGLYIFFALVWLCCSCAGSQYGRSRSSRLFYSNRYKGNLLSAKQQCNRALRKKYKKRHKKLLAWSSSSKSSSSSSSTAMAEVDPNDTPPPSKPKPKPKPAPQPQPKVKIPPEEKVTDNTKAFDEIPLEEKYKREKEVLEANDIEPLTNDKKNTLSQKVAKDIANDNFPQELDPLYFITAEDEFSVVDMDPFLVAVEYALQGKMILIEGHTDNVGGSEYNMQLSIKRVEKIRSLMHDMGVPDERISVVGYGEENPKYDNSTAEGRQKNRRVDFKVF